MQNFAVIARIQELCNARGWTYYRLAKESGITYSTLSTMLNKENIFNNSASMSARRERSRINSLREQPAAFASARSR